MICKNCKTLIEDNCERCPFCGKSPRRSNRRRALLTAVVLILCASLIGFSASTVSKANKTRTPTTAATAAQTSAVTTEPKSVAYATSLQSASAQTHSLDKTANDGYATVNILKSALKKADSAEIAEFCGGRFSADDCAWLAFIFEDGTGITFYGGKAIALYGKVNELGLVMKPQGLVSLGENESLSYQPLKNGLLSKPEQTASQAAVTETTKSAHAAEEEDGTTAESSATTQQKNEDKSAVVYVTAFGKKYHREGCSYLSESKIAISLSDAKARGYQPCSRCKP